MGEEINKPVASYTSHPIKNYVLGRWRFENATLHIDKADDAADFKKLHDSLPLTEKMRVRKLDLAAAEQISRDSRSAFGGATKQSDSTVGERPRDAASLGESIGKGDLLKGLGEGVAPGADQNHEMGDNNTPKPGTGLPGAAPFADPNDPTNPNVQVIEGQAPMGKIGADASPGVNPASPAPAEPDETIQGDKTVKPENPLLNALK